MSANSHRDSDRSDVESRRSFRSQRRLTVGRRMLYAVAAPLARLLLVLLWRSYRVERTIGADIADALVAEKTACIPCYWHQQHLVCANVFRQWIRRGFQTSIVISASVDGEVPAKIAGAWGAEVIRGSANLTGSLVLRDMRAALERGRSIPIAPDGPNGPNFEFKTGNILVARIAAAPLVPMACAADRYWSLTSWDRTMIPKPFARLVLGIGKPYAVPPDAPMDELEQHKMNMQTAMLALREECDQALRAGDESVA